MTAVKVSSLPVLCVSFSRRAVEWPPTSSGSPPATHALEGLHASPHPRTQCSPTKCTDSRWSCQAELFDMPHVSIAAVRLEMGVVGGLRCATVRVHSVPVGQRL